MIGMKMMNKMLDNLTTTYYPYDFLDVKAKEYGTSVYIPNNNYNNRLLNYLKNLYCKQLISVGFDLVRVVLTNHPWYDDIIITNFDYDKLTKAKDEIAFPVDYDGYHFSIGV